ncbi:MAG: YigZ family protein [Xanthomonadales bacterium]|nr:YigZ family protein [Xanthomonadales bacterium]
MRTLAGTTRIELVIKRSRFVAHASRVEDLAGTLAFYESVADPDASHNCWAWKLGQQYRFNDDGEPSGTAGKPIYSAIDGKGLDQAMVVVTRYFGGVKLGAGGLVRAYAGSAARCIDQAAIEEIEPRLDCVIRVGFGWTGQVYAALDACGARKTGERYSDDGIEITADIGVAAFETLKSLLRDTTRGEAVVRRAS